MVENRNFIFNPEDSKEVADNKLGMGAIALACNTGIAGAEIAAAVKVIKSDNIGSFVKWCLAGSLAGHACSLMKNCTDRLLKPWYSYPNTTVEVAEEEEDEDVPEEETEEETPEEVEETEE